MTGAALGHPVYRDMPTTIFEQMSALARETGAINLGQGFPDTPGPADILNVAADALLSRSNQYPPMAGLPELRAAVASQSRLVKKPQGARLRYQCARVVWPLGPSSQLKCVTGRPPLFASLRT